MKTNLRAGTGPRQKGTFGWREHRGDGEEGQSARAVTCTSRRNQRNHRGSLPFDCPPHLEQSFYFLLSSAPKITHPLPHPVLNFDRLSSSKGPNQHPVSMETAVHIPVSTGTFWTQMIRIKKMCSNIRLINSVLYSYKEMKNSTTAILVLQLARD